jgi:hypothetical protein
MFASLEMEFLGHVLSQERVKANPKKIQLIKKWQSLVIAKGVRYFLRLANFYKKFIKDFLTLGKSLTDLLKKEWSFEWKDKQQVAFDILRENLTFTMFLRFPNFLKPFEVQQMQMGLQLDGC